MIPSPAVRVAAGWLPDPQTRVIPLDGVHMALPTKISQAQHSKMPT